MRVQRAMHAGEAEPKTFIIPKNSLIFGMQIVPITTLVPSAADYTGFAHLFDRRDSTEVTFNEPGLLAGLFYAFDNTADKVHEWYNLQVFFPEPILARSPCVIMSGNLSFDCLIYFK